MAIEGGSELAFSVDYIDECGLRHIAKCLHVHFGQATLAEMGDPLEQVARQSQLILVRGNLSQMRKKRGQIPIVQEAITEQCQSGSLLI